MEQLVSRLGTLQQAGQAALNTAQRRLGQIAKEKEVWVQKEASGLISSEIVNNKLQALTEEEQTLQTKLSNRSAASKHTAWTLTRAINLLSRLPELFAGSQPEQKRKILNLIFANLSLKDKKLEIIYKKPFNLLAEGSKCCIWGQTDSALLTYVIEQEELLTVYLDDLDHDYDVAPSTLGLDYHLICNQWFGQPVNCR